MSENLLLLSTKNYTALKSFVEGENLKIAVSGIVGDIHLEAAKYALETAEVSVSPRDRVKSAITHLEAAHIAFKQIHDQHKNPLTYLPRINSIECAALKDAFVLCIMACCYTYLKDLAPSAKVLNLAEKAFAIPTNSPSFKWYEWPIALGIGTPLRVVTLPNEFMAALKTSALEESLALGEKEFPEFRKRIESMHRNFY